MPYPVRTKMVHNGVTTGYTYDNANRITSAGADTYAFDDNGNMTAKVHAGATTSFTYDPEDQLTQVTSGAATSAYTYDTDGMRTKKVAAASTTNYYYDGLSPTLETDASDALKNSYTTDPASPTGEILFRQDASSAYAYYLTDALGSTKTLLNDSQQVTKSYSYDAFGNITSQSGSTPNNYTFSGKELDETGLYYFAARYYDATLGRFTSEDPVAADLVNPQTIDAFVYCLNNPMLLIDPTGLEGWMSKDVVEKAADAANDAIRRELRSVPKEIGRSAVRAGGRVMDQNGWKCSVDYQRRFDAAFAAASIYGGAVTCAVMAGICAAVGPEGWPAALIFAIGGVLLVDFAGKVAEGPD